MQKPNNAPWILGATIACVIIVALGYFFGINPKLDSAEVTTEYAEDQESRNDILAMEVQRLAAEYEKLDEHQKDIDTMRIGIPVDPHLPELFRDLDDLADQTNVTIAHTSPNTPEEVPVTEEAAEIFTASGLIAMPIDFDVTGNYDNVTEFIKKIQKDLPRHFLITALDYTPEDDADNQITNREYALTIQGNLYALAEETSENENDPQLNVPGYQPQNAPQEDDNTDEEAETTDTNDEEDTPDETNDN